MRLRSLAPLLASAWLLAAAPALADKGAKASPPPQPTLAEQVVFTARGDAELVARAMRVPKLPSTLDARDKAVVGRAVVLFRSGRIDLGRAELTRWINLKGARLSVDDATAAVLWVTREAVASRRADLVSAAERIQEIDGRVLVLEAAVADLRVAATKRRATVINALGDDDASRTTHSESVSHEDLASRLATAEEAQQKAEAERASARDAFVSLQGSSRVAIGALVSCVRVALERGHH